MDARLLAPHRGLCNDFINLELQLGWGCEPGPSADVNVRGLDFVRERTDPSTDSSDLYKPNISLTAVFVRCELSMIASQTASPVRPFFFSFSTSHSNDGPSGLPYFS